MSVIENWRHKEEWKREGKTHVVVISRHKSYGDGNNWCVYLYIYPGHPRFSQFKPDGDMWEQPSFECHSYVSFFKTHRREDGTVGSYQLGWDYNHNGDNRFLEYATPDDAASVFWDADRLFEEAAA